MKSQAKTLFSPQQSVIQGIHKPTVHRVRPLHGEAIDTTENTGLLQKTSCTCTILPSAVFGTLDENLDQILNDVL